MTYRNKKLIICCVIVFIICLHYTHISANGSENCDCAIFQLISEGTNTYRNLTKQSDKINGRTFYFSEIKDILWWNDTSNTWEFQMYLESLDTYLPIFQSEKNFSCLNSPNKADEIFAQSSDIGVIKAKCLENPFKCFGIQEESGEIDQFRDGTNIIIPFNATTKAPCVFPFIYKDEIYTSCTKKDAEKFWCATSVNDTKHYQNGESGLCNDFCPTVNTLVYRIEVHARSLILRTNSPLHGLILVCTFIDFEKKFPLHVYSILCEQPYFGLHVY